jgi:AcrR family transcriptional regulator
MKKRGTETEARRRIVNTALDLFYRQGYLATGINQVIAEAGVSKNTFYYYFPSKEDVCVAYLKERHIVWIGWLRAAIDKYDQPYERLMAIFEFLDSWLTECGFRGCAFLNIASEVPDINHRIRKEVVAHKNELRESLKELIKDVKTSDPNFSDIDPDSLADAMYVIVEGIIGSCQSYGNTSTIPASRKYFETLLRSGK